MDFVVEFLRIGQLQIVLHVWIVTHSHEIVIPAALAGYHEETKEFVGQ